MSEWPHAPPHQLQEVEQTAKVGDKVAIDEKYRGIVVADIDGGEYSERCDSGWGYLKTGILVDTDFGGLVHYPNGEHERIVLLGRAK